MSQNKICFLEKGFAKKRIPFIFLSLNYKRTEPLGVPLYAFGQRSNTAEAVFSFGSIVLHLNPFSPTAVPHPFFLVPGMYNGADRKKGSLVHGELSNEGLVVILGDQRLGSLAGAHGSVFEIELCHLYVSLLWILLSIMIQDGSKFKHYLWTLPIPQIDCHFLQFKT